MVRDSRINRRKAIKTIGGAAGVGLLAGCTGDGNGNGGNGGNSGGNGGGNGGNGGSGNGNGNGNGDNGGNGGNGDASNYPEDDMRMLIPFAAGGGYDAYSRLVAKHLPDHLPNDVNVQPENVTGSGGRIALQELVRAEPDALTLSIMHVQRFSQQHVLYEPDYDLREFTWLPQIVQERRVISAGTNTDIETFEDYVEATRNEELTYGTKGLTSGDVIIQTVLGSVSGLFDPSIITDNRVDYNGSAEIMQGILGGDVDIMAGTWDTHTQYYESDDLRPIIYFGEEPPEGYEDVTTYSSAEPEIENGEQIADAITVRRAFATTPGVPDERASILSDAIASAIQSDALQEEAEEMGRAIDFADAESTSTAVTNAVDTWESEEMEPIIETFEEAQ